MKPEELHSVTILKGGKPTDVKPERVKEIVEEVAYWRKANAIHHWFVENVQDGVDDCKEYAVDKEQLDDLLQLVRLIRKEPNRAADLLPTQAGFFFGDTEYRDWYFDDLRYTEEALTAALAEQGTGSFYYHSSW